MAIFQHNPLIRARISQPFPPKVIEDGPKGPATPPSQGKGNVFSHNFVSPAFINTLCTFGKIKMLEDLSWKQFLTFLKSEGEIRGTNTWEVVVGIPDQYRGKWLQSSLTLSPRAGKNGFTAQLVGELGFNVNKK